MVGLDPVVGVPLGAVPRRWEQFLQHQRIGRCSVGDDLHRHYLRRADCPLQDLVALRGNLHPSSFTPAGDTTLTVVAGGAQPRPPVMAVPSGAIAGALANVRGLQGKPTIDATNASTGRNQT
jgi:hypothetical protein